MKQLIKPLEIIMPFPETEFAEMWNTYKEYLINTHKVHIGSRAELSMLETLKKWSCDNERTAIEMLKYSISKGFKHFYKLECVFNTEGGAQ